jgi:hypothetical protein
MMVEVKGKKEDPGVKVIPAGAWIQLNLSSTSGADYLEVANTKRMHFIMVCLSKAETKVLGPMPKLHGFHMPCPATHVKRK